MYVKFTQKFARAPKISLYYSNFNVIKLETGEHFNNSKSVLNQDTLNIYMHFTHDS